MGNTPSTLPVSADVSVVDTGATASNSATSGGLGTSSANSNNNKSMIQTHKSKLFMNKNEQNEILSQSIHPGVPKSDLLNCETSAQKLLSLINDEDAHSEFIGVRRLIQRVVNTIEDISKNNRYKSLFKKGESSDTSKELQKLLDGLNQVFNTLYGLLSDHLEDSMVSANPSTVPNPDAYNELYYLIKEECTIMLEHHYEQFKLYRKYLTDCKNHAQNLKQAPEDLSLEDFMKMANKQDFDVATYFGNDKDAQIFWARYYGPKIFSVKKEEFLKNYKTQLEENEQRKAKRRQSYKQSITTGSTGSMDMSAFGFTWVPEFEVLMDPTCDGYVSVADFKSFLGWFGPMETSCQNADALLNSPFFWGSLTSLDAQALLDREETGTFLVRFNESKPGSFYITCVEEQTDENGFNGNGGGQMTYMGEDEISQAIHFKVNKEKEKNFWLSGSDKGHTTIQSLLNQYELTFKIPFNQEKLKYKAITDFRIKDEEEEDDEDLGFHAFLRKTAYKGLNRPLLLQDLNFATFRGRIPDIPFVPREDDRRKKKKEKRNLISTSRRPKLTARRETADDNGGNTGTHVDLEDSSNSIVIVDVPASEMTSPTTVISPIEESVYVHQKLLP
jgi:hypothetical protein